MPSTPSHHTSSVFDRYSFPFSSLTFLPDPRLSTPLSAHAQARARQEYPCSRGMGLLTDVSHLCVCGGTQCVVPCIVCFSMRADCRTLNRIRGYTSATMSMRCAHCTKRLLPLSNPLQRTSTLRPRYVYAFAYAMCRCLCVPVALAYIVEGV